MNPQTNKLHLMKRAAVSELLAACDLLERGFEVFRSVSFTASCDLIVLVGEQPYRVEVRTGHRSALTKVTYTSLANTRAEILALVIDGKVEYRPIGDNELPPALQAGPDHHADPEYLSWANSARH